MAQHLRHWPKTKLEEQPASWSIHQAISRLWISVPVFSNKISGVWLVEMAISTNQMPDIWVKLLEYTHARSVLGAAERDRWKAFTFYRRAILSIQLASRYTWSWFTVRSNYTHADTHGARHQGNSKKKATKIVVPVSIKTTFNLCKYKIFG